MAATFPSLSVTTATRVLRSTAISRKRLKASEFTEIDVDANLKGHLSVQLLVGGLDDQLVRWAFDQNRALRQD